MEIIGSYPLNLIEAVQSKRKISGLTHNFYRYPARFSPEFANSAIKSFSNPGDIVLDPYMGGGTTIVEAIALGRRAYGSDLNPLAVFVTRAKTTFLNDRESEEVIFWIERLCEKMSFRSLRSRLESIIDDPKVFNLTLPHTRPIKKAIAAALFEISKIDNEHVNTFVRCILLRAAQWALDGRITAPALENIRRKLPILAIEMLNGLEDLREKSYAHNLLKPKCVILESNAASLDYKKPFCSGKVKADLVVTSPPYPGVHVLYHRWQINGRRETPAPYWITDCCDGKGSAFYNFGDRRGGGINKYFRTSLDTLLTIRRLIRDGGKVVQLVAFGEPDSQLPKYLENMRAAGFREIFPIGRYRERIWREVPSRKWHASIKGRTNASREVTLFHQAI
jgi:DNA modification methylase